MTAVLSGIRVLDFGRYVAGPLCSMMLADLGAEVIRIEKIDGGEDRYLCPVGGEGGVGAIYLQLNRNKQCLTLNPMKKEGREVVRRLVASADVVVANLPDESLAAMALDYESLRSIRPNIILAKASAYGSSGPYKDKLGFDGTGQAMSGAMYLSGYGDEPLRTYTAWVDNGTGLSLAFGVVAALLHRQKTGEGQMVGASLLGTSLAFNADALIEQQLTQINRRATGNRGQKNAPSDSFRSSDGKRVMVQITGSAMFKRWADLMGESHWLDDPRFSDDVARAEHGSVLSERMALWCAERDMAEIIATLESASVPCAPIYSPAEALRDPHISSSAFFAESAYAGFDTPINLVLAPVRFSTLESAVRHGAPRLGEHTNSILGDLGYTETEIETMRKLRVV